MSGRRALLVLACSLALAVRAAGDEPRRTNVLFFLSDDQRNDLLGCAGHPLLKTPNLDRLAADGTRFENAFVTTPICAASRATFLTGTVERTHRYTFQTPPVTDALIADSYPAVLRRHGYRTGFVGKFGIKTSKPARRTMFDVDKPLDRNPYFKPQPDGSTRYVEDIAGDVAVDFLKTQPQDTPFCLSVSFNAPHAEDRDKANLYPAPERFRALYADAPIPSPPRSDEQDYRSLPPFLQTAMGRERWHWQFDTPEKYARNVRDYYAMISEVDAVVGRVLGEVERLGFADDTVVIFAGDNGYFLGERGISGKWIHYEESLRVPLIIYDPRLPAERRGRVAAPIALNLDVPPTILDYAGVERPVGYQGRSLVPIVRGETPADWRTDFLAEHLMENPGLPKWEGVRGERYVYARYFEQTPPYEVLHDLRTDPHELRNLAADPAEAATLSKMRARTDELRDALGGPY